MARLIHQDGETDFHPGHAGLDEQGPGRFFPAAAGVGVFVVLHQAVVHVFNVPGAEHDPGALAAGAVGIF